MTTTTLSPFPRHSRARSFWERATRLINPLVLRILRSPLHGLLSGRVLIISVRGRKTGNLYHVPVEYRQRRGEITILSHQDRAWWHNLEGGAAVDIHLRGLEIPAVGQLLTDRRSVISEVHNSFHMPMDRAAAFASGKVVIKLRLNAL